MSEIKGSADQAAAKIELLNARLAALGNEESTERADLLNELSGEWSISDPSRSLEWGREALRVSEFLHYEKGRGQALGNMGFAHYLVSDHEAAHQRLLQADRVLRAIEEQLLLSRVLGALAGVHLSLGDYENALTESFEALALQRQLGDTYSEAWTLNGIGGGYHEMGDYERALSFHRQSLKNFEAVGHEVGKARALNGIGTVYQSEKQYDKAREYHEESLKIFEKAANTLGRARALNDLGLIAQETGDYEKALECHTKALELRRQTGNKQAQSTSLINLGNLNIQLGDAERALDMLHRALTIAMEIRAKPRVYQANLALSEAHALRGDYVEALEHYKIYQQIKEEVAGDQTSSRLKNLQIGFEVEKAEREAEISRLKNVELKEKNDRLESLLKELQETQMQLVQSEKMAALGSLVAGLVHEMNTPLGVIHSAADVSTRCVRVMLEVLSNANDLESIKNDAKFNQSLQTLQIDNHVTEEATSRISRIVGSLKSFIHLDEASFQNADLNNGLNNALTLLEHELKNRITVEKDLGDIPLVPSNAAEINQVFMNLLTNAAQAIDGEGRISVRTFVRGDKVHVQIADTGVGIADEQLGRLFNPEITRRGARVKAGMGLFAAHNIITKHKGEIRVESGQGEGAIFTVIIPTNLKGPAHN